MINLYIKVETDVMSYQVCISIVHKVDDTQLIWIEH